MSPKLQPYTNARSDHSVRFLDAWTVVRSGEENTNGAFCLIEQVIPAGFASPYHVHRREDEAFYVLEGKIAVVADGKWIHAGPGDYVFGPRDVPHGFKVPDDAPARILILCAPAGFDQFVLEMSEPEGTPAAPPDLAKLIAVAAKYGIEILGPLPEE
jgi:quercetin dioxygenase-like cupin family protein